MIAVVDYGMGNLRSVLNALAAVGADAQTLADPSGLHEASGVVLPGVGAFGDGMRRLKARGFVEALECQVRQKGKPLLGICLGLQLLATTGTEQGRHDGLGWIPGVVERIPAESSQGPLRVPHIGWNDVEVKKTSGLFAGLEPSQSFYFVHSYHLLANDPAVVSGTCEYGRELVAAVEAGNIFATQFHPEKSHRAGLRLLRNFVRICAGADTICSRSA